MNILNTPNKPAYDCQLSFPEKEFNANKQAVQVPEFGTVGVPEVGKVYNQTQVSWS